MDHKSAGSTVTIQISIHVLASCPIIWLVYNQFVGFFPNYQCVSGYSQQHCCILTPGKVPRCQNTVQYHTKKDFPIKCVDVGIRFSFFIQPSGWTKNWQSIIFVFGCGKDSPHPHMQCFDWIDDFFPLWFCIPTGWTKKKINAALSQPYMDWNSATGWTKIFFYHFCPCPELDFYWFILCQNSIIYPHCKTISVKISILSPKACHVDIKVSDF